jgi:hypothetical protein
MSAYHAPALDAIALQLVGALEKYEADVVAMTDSWQDFELYNTVSTQLDQIRMYSSALPEVRVQWVELLIAHAELIHGMWRAQYGRQADPAEKTITVRDHHAAAVAALRNRCQRLVSGSQQRRG